MKGEKVMDKEIRPTLNLCDLRNYGYEFERRYNDHFQLDSAKNTTLFIIGSCLSTKQVEEAIQNGWIVNIKAAG